MKSLKCAAKFTIYMLTLMVLALMDQIAIENYMYYGLILRGIVWFLIVYNIVGAVITGGAYFGALLEAFRDDDVVEVTKGVYVLRDKK